VFCGSRRTEFALASDMVDYGLVKIEGIQPLSMFLVC